VDPGDELVDVVDEDDRVLRVLTRREIRAQNLLHRCTYVLVRRSDGLIHVHRRTETKDTDPGAYDMLPGGVCDAGESYEACARREMGEELGIDGVDPQFRFKHRYSGPDGETWGAVYTLTWDGPIVPQEEEVAWFSWVTTSELDRMLGEERFCPDSREIYARLRLEL
jgi:isopentenyldiphosphate isomerase